MLKKTKELEYTNDKIIEKKSKNSTMKSTSKKDVASVKKTTKAKASTSESNSKSVKKNTSKKTTTKPAKSKIENKVSLIEYYDLPYRYNQTIVKILAQTPNILFVYWDISDSDKTELINAYGNDFFSKSKPVLIVYNETLNYSFEIEINDFANSWYLHVKDSNCKYEINLCRRAFEHISTVSDDCIYITSSNELDTPNNHILFEKFNKNVTYKNTKNGNLSTKDFSTVANCKNMQKIYNIYDLYKEIYHDELFNEMLENDINNPSSNSSSSFK